MDECQRPVVSTERNYVESILYCIVHPGHTEQDEESVRRNELRAASFDEKQSMNQETGGQFDSKMESERTGRKAR